MGRAVVVIVNCGKTIVMLNVLVSDVCGVPESFTVTATLLVPAGPVGFPEIAPVAALMVRPAGRPTADHVYEPVPPLAEI